jgi:hypothetical protein
MKERSKTILQITALGVAIVALVVAMVLTNRNGAENGAESNAGAEQNSNPVIYANISLNDATVLIRAFFADCGSFGFDQAEISKEYAKNYVVPNNGNFKAYTSRAQAFDRCKDYLAQDGFTKPTDDIERAHWTTVSNELKSVSDLDVLDENIVNVSVNWTVSQQVRNTFSSDMSASEFITVPYTSIVDEDATFTVIKTDVGFRISNITPNHWSLATAIDTDRNMSVPKGFGNRESERDYSPGYQEVSEKEKETEKQLDQKQEFQDEVEKMLREEGLIE